MAGETFVFFIELGVSFSSDLRFRDDDDEDVCFDLALAGFAISSSRLRRSSSTLMRTLFRDISIGSSKTGRGTVTIPIVDTVARLRLPSQLDPTLKCKIDAFRAVEAEVETRVIPSWERDHKFASILDEGIGTT